MFQKGINYYVLTNIYFHLEIHKISIDDNWFKIKFIIKDIIQKKYFNFQIMIAQKTKDNLLKNRLNNQYFSEENTVKKINDL